MLTESDHESARALVLRFGWNATAYQILNPGIELWFSRCGDGVVGFVRHGSTRVVGGAPVCDLARLDAIVAEFMDDARAIGERVCFFGAGERLESRLGGSSQWSRGASEAQPVWDPNRWPGAVGGVARSARNSTARATRGSSSPSGRMKWRRIIPPSDNASPTGCSRGGCLHFISWSSPETLSDLRDRRVFVAERKGSDAVAFAILSPVPARHGWLVEQIVRGRHAPNGTAELLIDFAMRAVAESGSRYATLGLSPLSERAMLIAPSPPLWLRLTLRWVRLHGARFYNFVGLDTFKAKFNPEVWEPIFAISEGTKFGPRDLYAIAGAFSGGALLRLIGRAIWRAARQELASLFRPRT